MGKGLKRLQCYCRVKPEWFFKVYKNGSEHLFPRCPQCGYVPPSATSVKDNDFDRQWLDSLPRVRVLRCAGCPRCACA